MTDSFFSFGRRMPEYGVPVLNERAVRAAAGILFFFAMVSFMNAWLTGKLGKEACEVRRVPAGEIEGVVVEQLRGVLRAPEILAEAVREVTLSRPDISEADAIQTLQSIDQVWDNLFPAEQACIAKALIEQITVRKDGISIKWKFTGMTKLLRDTVMQQAYKEAA